MHLQWFPGHMTRAMRMMEEQVKLCDGIVAIPMYGKINSLNASVATGVAVFEVVRQRNWR